MSIRARRIFLISRIVSIFVDRVRRAWYERNVWNKKKEYRFSEKKAWIRACKTPYDISVMLSLWEYHISSVALANVFAVCLMSLLLHCLIVKFVKYKTDFIEKRNRENSLCVPYKRPWLLISKSGHNRHTKKISVWKKNEKNENKEQYNKYNNKRLFLCCYSSFVLHFIARFHKWHVFNERQKRSFIATNDVFWTQHVSFDRLRAWIKFWTMSGAHWMKSLNQFRESKHKIQLVKKRHEEIIEIGT